MNYFAEGKKKKKRLQYITFRISAWRLQITNRNMFPSVENTLPGSVAVLYPAKHCFSLAAGWSICGPVICALSLPLGFVARRCGRCVWEWSTATLELRLECARTHTQTPILCGSRAMGNAQDQKHELCPDWNEVSQHFFSSLVSEPAIDWMRRPIKTANRLSIVICRAVVPYLSSGLAVNFNHAVFNHMEFTAQIITQLKSA